MRGRVTRNLESPLLWGQQRRWSPRRYFGPIFGNSPDLHLNGELAQFVYGQFFAGHPDAAVFRKYYGATLPSNVPTLPDAIPGTIPGGGFRDVRLGLDRLTYSSRYGGSFKLAFLPIEDLQIEYRKGNAAWDIASLEVGVYVRPVATTFNSNGSLSSVPIGDVHVEFRPQGVAGYTVSGSGLALQEGDPLPALMAALSATANVMVGASGQSFRLDAGRFSHGFVHAEFWEEIGQTRTVTGIEISDDLFFPRTTAGLPVAVVTTQVSDISLDTEPGNEEINISTTAVQVFQDQDLNSAPSFTWEFPEIDNHGATGQRVVGVFPLNWDCGRLETIVILVEVRERDDFQDDRFSPSPDALHLGRLNCAGMQTAFDSGQFGLFDEFPPQQFLLMQDGEVAGAMNMRTRIFVVKQ